MYVYITMGLHRKAGFHWRKRASHCVRRKVWKSIGNWRQGYQLGCLIWSWENVYVPGEKFERFWPRGEILLRFRPRGNLILRRCNGRLAVAINVGQMSFLAKSYFAAFCEIPCSVDTVLYSVHARKFWRNKLAKLRRCVVFSKNSMWKKYTLQ